MTLTHICPRCDGEGTRETSRHGGNDPDTWRIACESCDGQGQSEMGCDTFGCDGLAAAIIDDLPLCAKCAAEYAQ